MMMALSNVVISGLQKITAYVNDKSSLNSSDTEVIKDIFRDIIKNGEKYDVNEVEQWLEVNYKNKDARVRITNISHYMQAKHEQSVKFRIVSNEDDDCSCH